MIFFVLIMPGDNLQTFGTLISTTLQHPGNPPQERGETFFRSSFEKNFVISKIVVSLIYQNEQTQ